MRVVQPPAAALAGALAALAALLPAAPAVAAGRWYAWLDRVSPGQAEAAAARWSMRGVPVTRVPSERFFGVDAGFVYLFAAESLFQADAQAYVGRLEGGGFKGTGVQYFSDAVPTGVGPLLGGEPVFAVDADVDRTGPPEIVALTRGPDGDLLRVMRRHVDGTLSLEASHAARLYDLPRVTEGERARAFPLGKDASEGMAVVFEAAFDEPEQAAHWSMIFAFRATDLRVPPQVYFVPGARRPVPTRVTFEHTPAGLAYQVTVEGLRTGPRVRKMLWGGDRFIDAAARAEPPRGGRPAQPAGGVAPSGGPTGAAGGGAE